MSRKITDLTFPIHEGMTTFPVHWHPFIEISQLGRHGIEDRETRKLVLGTHTGTHCDAPVHFIPGAMTIDEVPLETFVGEATLLDLTSHAPFSELGIDDLKRALEGRAVGERLVLRYDWSDHWGQRTYYTDHPFLSETAAEWLVSAGVRLLAMDTPMPDNPLHGWKAEKDSPIHKILLGNGVILTEYLCNLRLLNSKVFELVVLPMKIKGADGAPARVIAIEESK